MAKKEGISGGMVALTTFIGGLLGAAAGILLAPQSGKRTQEKILETYESTAKNVGNTLQKIDDATDEFIAEITAEVKGLPEQIKGDVNRITKEAEEALSKTVQKGSTYFDELSVAVTDSVQEGKKKFVEKKEQIIQGK